MRSWHPTVWQILDERVVDESRRLRLSIASVELPDGVQFEQFEQCVLRLPKAAMVVVDDDGRVLMMPVLDRLSRLRRSSR